MNDAQKTYILIVDDTPQNLVTYKAILSELNQHLIFANSAKEALRQILKYDFAVILLDVQMPDIDGFETAKLIRARERSSYTPIIFLSAFSQEEIDINQGYSMGAVDYILKPVNPLVLRSKVKVFVDLFTKSILAINLQKELKKSQRAELRTRKQQHQLELVELDRLSTIEEMSSALAHELNQPLTVISNYVQGCVHRLKNGDYQVEQLITALQRAGQQAERAGAILHRIKNFVRKNKLYYEPVVINELISNITLLLEDAIKESQIKLIFKLYKKDIPVIFLDKVQIEQVLLNLLRNSIEALTICPANNKQLSIETLLNSPEQKLIINVKDNGGGISAEHAAKVFELYFTTKSTGMGMGLSICRTIIEAHGGQIVVKNHTQQGAWFQITLPLITEKPHVG